MSTKTVLILIGLALILVILLQNTQAVVFQLFFWQISVSKIILIPVAMVVGFGVGYLVAKTHRKAPGQPA